MAECSVKVSLEKVVHDQFRELAKSIFDAHGIRIESMAIDWLDVSTNSKRDMIVAALAMSTTTFQK